MRNDYDTTCNVYAIVCYGLYSSHLTINLWPQFIAWRIILYMYACDM